MAKVTVYRVKDWSTHYENNRTRDMKEMQWVPFKNSHDGEGYCQMVAGPDGASVFGAFVACVEVASRCHPRGTLLRKGGEPHDSVSLASRTRLPLEAFEEMLKRAIKPSIQWLELVEIEVDTVESEIARTLPAPSPHPSAVSSVPFRSVPFPSNEGVKGEKAPPRFKPQDLDTIYHAYPRKVGSGQAKNAIQRALVKLIGHQADPVLFLLDRVETFAKSPAGNAGQYTPHPTTWFNGERYNDDPNEWKKESHNGNGTHRQIPANDPNARRAAQRAEQYDEQLELPPSLLARPDETPRL